MNKPLDDNGVVKRKPGRPQKFSPEQLQTIYNDFSEYIEKTEDPTIVGFCSSYEIDNKYVHKDFISERKEYSVLVKKAIGKQEDYLLHQFKNPTLAIFRLKQPQHGYTDKREVETHNINLDVKADANMAKDFALFLKQQTHQG